MSERVGTDDLHVVWPRAAGLDVHKMCITVAVRLCEAGRRWARTAVHEFSALPPGLREMTDWLLSHGVTAAVMEGTGVYWKAPFEALEDAGIDAALLNARQVKQIRGKKTDVSDSLWLARICQFGLALPSHVPPRRFRQLRQLTRYRRTLAAERCRNRNRIHKTFDHDGLRLGGILSDIFGVNGRHILDGLVAGHPPRVILAGLTSHVAAKLEPLAQALAATLDPLALLKLNAPTAPCAPKTRSSTAITGRWPVASVTSGPSSPPPTSCCESSTPCCATTGPAPTRKSITNASSSSATRRAGSACSSSTASWPKSEPPAAPDSNAPVRRRRDGP